jgi:hypothetical protein
MKPLNDNAPHRRHEPIALKARSAERIENGLGQRVTALKGALWITQTDDERDTVLTAGQSFVLDRNGLAIVFALSDALVTIGAGNSVPLIGRSAA